MTWNTAQKTIQHKNISHKITKFESSNTEIATRKLTIHKPLPIWRNVSSSYNEIQIIQNLNHLQQTPTLICTIYLQKFPKNVQRETLFQLLAETIQDIQITLIRVAFLLVPLSTVTLQIPHPQETKSENNATKTLKKSQFSVPKASNFQENKQNPILLVKKPRTTQPPRNQTQEGTQITLEGSLSKPASETRRQQQEKETSNPLVGFSEVRTRTRTTKRIKIWVLRLEGCSSFVSLISPSSLW